MKECRKLQPSEVCLNYVTKGKSSSSLCFPLPPVKASAPRQSGPLRTCAVSHSSKSDLREVRARVRRDCALLINVTPLPLDGSGATYLAKSDLGAVRVRAGVCVSM
jgi:hypothetical protein